LENGNFGRKKRHSEILVREKMFRFPPPKLGAKSPLLLLNGNVPLRIMVLFTAYRTILIVFSSYNVPQCFFLFGVI